MQPSFNCRHATFFCDGDYLAYLRWFDEVAKRIIGTLVSRKYSRMLIARGAAAAKPRLSVLSTFHRPRTGVAFKAPLNEWLRRICWLMVHIPDGAP
jgi:hypothetical protein